VRWCFQGPSSEWLRTTVVSLVLEFDRLILESAIYWMVPGRPFNTRVPEERRGGRCSTTYERRLRASNQRNARVKGVRWIALKWKKQQKGRYPSYFHFPKDMARDTDVFKKPHDRVIIHYLGHLFRGFWSKIPGPKNPRPKSAPCHSMLLSR